MFGVFDDAFEERQAVTAADTCGLIVMVKSPWPSRL
jgi:hypothetical protein